PAHTGAGETRKLVFRSRCSFLGLQQLFIPGPYISAYIPSIHSPHDASPPSRLFPTVFLNFPFPPSPFWKWLPIRHAKILNQSPDLVPSRQPLYPHRFHLRQVAAVPLWRNLVRRRPHRLGRHGLQSGTRSEEHTSELQSLTNIGLRL